MWCLLQEKLLIIVNPSAAKKRVSSFQTFIYFFGLRFTALSGEKGGEELKKPGILSE